MKNDSIFTRLRRTLSLALTALIAATMMACEGDDKMLTELPKPDDGNGNGTTEITPDKGITLYGLVSDKEGNPLEGVVVSDGYSVVAEVPFRVIEVPTAYVRDGLVAWYDGVENTRDGQDIESVVWHDKAGGYDLPVEHTETNAFEATGFHVRSGKFSFPQGIVDLIKGEEFTTEMQLGATQVTGSTWGTYLNAATDAYSLFYRLQDDAIEFKNGSNARPCKQEIGGKDALSDSTITVVFKVGEPSKIYINGELAAEAASAATAALAVEDYFFGHAAAEKSHTTEYIKFRFYDRALTADEVAQNYAADQAEVVFGDGDGDDTSSGAPVSSAAPVESSTDAPVSSSAPTSSTPSTGDAGIAAFAVLALIALAGVVVVKKAR